MNTKEIIESLKVKKKLPAFRVGDTVRVHVKILEGEKERVQVFEGVVIKKRGASRGASFTVRKVSYGTGVERIFPVESAVVDKVEVTQRGKARRARLFYLRKQKGKATRIEKDTGQLEDSVQEGLETDAETQSDADMKSGSKVSQDTQNVSAAP